MSEKLDSSADLHYTKEGWGWLQRGRYELTIRIPTQFKIHENKLTRLSWVAPWSSGPWLFGFAPGLALVAGFELVWVGDPSDILKPEQETVDLGLDRPGRKAPIRDLKVEYEDTFVRLVSDQGVTTLPLPLWDKLLTDFHSGAKQAPLHGFTWVSDKLKVPNPLLIKLVS